MKCFISVSLFLHALESTLCLIESQGFLYPSVNSVSLTSSWGIRNMFLIIYLVFWHLTMCFDSKGNCPVLTHDETNGVFKCTSVLHCLLDIDCYCWGSLVWVSKMDFLTEICIFLKADVFNVVIWWNVLLWMISNCDQGLF